MNAFNIFLSIVLLAIILFIIAISMNNFTISVPSIYVKKNVKYILLSIFIACCIVGFIVRKFNIIFIVSVIIMTYIFFVIFMTVSTDDYIDSLPESIKPPPPHLGLDGISMNNIYTGM